MNIPELRLTREEMNNAVSNYLQLHGLKVVVKEVSTYGYPQKGWAIELECETVTEPAFPVIPPVKTELESLT